MIRDKAMVIIAVSRYAGAQYCDLPGTVVSAQKLRKWAEQPTDDCGYNVVYLGDDEHPEITTEIVTLALDELIGSTAIERLIVYFAGHGIARSAGEQFWLLTNAEASTTEGIDVEQFRRGLLKCNIGGSSQVVSTGQLCIIGDACRNVDDAAIDFHGHPIITHTGNRKRLQLDRFLSTSLGKFSYQIEEVNNESAYCLFSEVLVEALSGAIGDAIERDHHQFKPVVTNHSLANYMESEVQRRSANIGYMEPDLLTDIRPPYNYYKLVFDPALDHEVEPKSLEEVKAHSMGGTGTVKAINAQIARDTSARRDALARIELIMQEGVSVAATDTKYSLSGPQSYFSAFSDFKPELVAGPRGAEFEIRSVGELFQIVMSYAEGAPMVIKVDDRWILVPHYPNVFAGVFASLPGDLLLFDPVSRGSHGLSGLDTTLSDFASLAGHAPLRAIDARNQADLVRRGKHNYPHRSVTAGYLYEFSNDFDNVARTAHFMARAYVNGDIQYNHSPSTVVPFDLALLCAERISWQSQNGKLVAFADLPAVRQRKPDDETYDRRPSFAHTGFEALADVPLWGIAPVFRQGWSFLATEDIKGVSDQVREIATAITGRSAVTFEDATLIAFLDAFNYEITSPFNEAEPAVASAS